MPTRTIQTGEVGLDYAYSSGKDPSVIMALGYSFVVRYITNSLTNTKQLSSNERDALLAAGIVILLVWETFATACLGGASAGAKDGALAKFRAQTLGYPIDPEVPILIACDTDVVPANIVAAEAYCRAFAAAAAPYPVGVYGDDDIITALTDISVNNWLANAKWWSWQAGPIDWAWVNVHCNVVQGPTDPLHGWDTNRCINPFKGWSATGDPVPAPAPTPEVVSAPPAPTLNHHLVLGGSMSAKSWFAKCDDGGPTRWLWNGYVLRRLDEPEANIDIVTSMAENTLDTAIAMTAAKLASFPETNI